LTMCYKTRINETVIRNFRCETLFKSETANVPRTGHKDTTQACMLCIIIHFQIVFSDTDSMISTKTGFGLDMDIIFQKQDSIGLVKIHNPIISGGYRTTHGSSCLKTYSTIPPRMTPCESEGTGS